MTQEVRSLDFLSQNAGEMVRKAHARDLAANVVQAVFRLVKLCTLHAMDNQAMVRQVEETVALIQEYGQRADQNVSILFAHGSIFVGGQLLKASRSVYEGATELGEVIQRCGAAELGIARDVRSADLYAFASAIAEAMRSSAPMRLERPSPRIRLRAISEAALARELQGGEPAASEVAVVRTYASAVVIMRRFFEDLARGKYVLPQRVKRIAQRLVDLSAGETPAFLGVTSVRNANHDDAGRAVNTAILSLAITRQITSDPLTLARVAMAALLYDTARFRLLGLSASAQPRGVIPQLSEEQDSDMPGGTAVVLTALGRVNEPSIMRTVIAYEAHWVKRQTRLGALYRGLRLPTLQARIVAVARAFNDSLTATPGQAPLAADRAIAALEASALDAADRTVLRLLVGALGIFPTGTLVELSTGEVAQVVQTPDDPSRYSQPRVRLVFDEAGGAAPPNVEVDLGRPPAPGQPSRHVRRVVATSDDASAPHLRQLASSPSIAPEASGVRAPPPDACERFLPSAGRRHASVDVGPPNRAAEPRALAPIGSSLEATHRTFRAAAIRRRA